jgi:hypothetical protein
MTQLYSGRAGLSNQLPLHNTDTFGLRNPTGMRERFFSRLMVAAKGEDTRSRRLLPASE